MNIQWMSRDDLELRRLSAAEDFQAGMRPADVARKFLVSRTTACRWRRNLATGKLRATKCTGRPCRLTSEQLQELATVYRTRLHWTYPEFGRVILERFGVKYTRDHVGRIIQKFILQSGVGTGQPRVSAAAPGAGGASA